MTFSPEVQAVIDRLEILTETEAKELAEARHSVYGSSRSAAWCSALNASDEATYSEAKAAAWTNAWDIAWTNAKAANCTVWDAAWCSAEDAIVAYLAGDKITAEQRDLLAGPWEQVIR